MTTGLNARASVRFLTLNTVFESGFNPVGRTDNVTTLAKDIETNGQLDPIHVVAQADGTFVTADGHRRLVALRNLGVVTVKAIVYVPNDGDVVRVLNQLYVSLNSPKKTLKQGQMLNAALQGGPDFVASVKSAKEQLLRMFSESEIEMLIEKEVTPTALSVARKVTSYVIPGVGKDTTTYLNRARNTLLYLLRNKNQQYVIQYMRLRYSPDALKNAIDRDLDVPRTTPEPAKKAERLRIAQERAAKAQLNLKN